MENQTYILQGSAALLPLSDLLQILNRDGHSLCICVTSPNGSGIIYVEEGELHSAQIESKQAMEALQTLLQEPHCTFYCSELDHLPQTRDFNEPLTYLLMEASRLNDEQDNDDDTPAM
jgi:hypothetical protein